MMYFDHNATAPMSARALSVWMEIAEGRIGNPSSPHRVGARADAALSEARMRVAETLGCAPECLTWTSGATESNNMVFHHLRRLHSEADAEVWVSAVEHPSVLAPARAHFGKGARLIPVNEDGRVEAGWVAENLKKRRPALVAVMAANNETGVLQPWEEVAAICREYETPFLCDAVQWVGKLPAGKLGGCDFVSASAHKFGGPKGAGFLKGPATGPWVSLLLGGPQEEGRRAGTENVPGICAMAAALAGREEMIARGEHDERMKWLQQFFARFLEMFPGAKVTGGVAPRLWNTAGVVMPRTACPGRWVVKLDKLGIAVSTGSACSSGKEKPSHVLEAMGLSAEESGRALRFSSGWETAREDWEELLAGLGKAYQELK